MTLFILIQVMCMMPEEKCVAVVLSTHRTLEACEKANKSQEMSWAGKDGTCVKPTSIETFKK